ncbi:PREDICTED: uncharacterized protein LOC109482239 [Branchiostoma belcheri]|uniref:Uncharacterized protein LOC109482239 n=1 Tax=Branchiostoma belcheri TaxID=7741 RepID=A0A6P5AF96_BRABE|nr:PREDICTED: uncharacterized protein LOC109482239 [Branchiostoma belcheri]
MYFGLDPNGTCSDSPCQNSAGCCEAPEGGWYCYCLLGYEEPGCTTFNDPCSSGENPCMQGGTCSFDSYSNQAYCQCPPGFTGRACEFATPIDCTSDECQNGGTCVPESWGDAWCSCPEGFSGPSCEFVIGECEEDTCMNGDCVEWICDGYYACNCEEGYSGTYCEVEGDGSGDYGPSGSGDYGPSGSGDYNETDGCSSSPCQNGASCCPEPDGGWYCDCPLGFDPPTCDTFNDPCSSGENPCMQGGTCHFDTTMPDYAYCNCPWGFTGKVCETTVPTDCSLDECQNGATCQTESWGDVWCSCPPDFTGPYCEFVVGECLEDSCENGHCRPVDCEGHYHECDCEEGYAGTFCEMAKGSGVYGPSGSGDYGPSGSGDYGPSGSGDYDPFGAMYFGLDPNSTCSDSPCQNHAGCCEAPEGGWYCYCLLGYEEPGCTTFNDPCSSGENPCMQGGTCSFDSYSNQAYCTCSDSPCQNHAGCCEAPEGGWYCYCLLGYEEPGCTTFNDPCSSGENPCMQGGTCSFDSYSNQAYCQCPPGFTGRACEFATPIDCTSDECQNGGTCVPESWGDAWCSCPEGFSGPSCEFVIGECEEDTCMNGDCVEWICDGYYACNCEEGYSGTYCEVEGDGSGGYGPSGSGDYGPSGSGDYDVSGDGSGDYNETDGCSSSPCQNGASCCPDPEGGWYCDCPLGFDPPTCDTFNDPCSSGENPCMQGGTCHFDTTMPDYAYCNCPWGFTGKVCETTVPTDCSLDECENGATCQTESWGDVYCSCPPDFTGPYCEFVVGECLEDSCENGHCRPVDCEGHYHECDCEEGYSGTFCEMAKGSGVYGPSGSGDYEPSGSGDYGPSGSGDDIPDGSGDNGPTGSGDDIPDGSGEEGPTGSGDYGPSGSGDDIPDGSGDDGPSGSGDDIPDGSGEEGPYGSGEEGPTGSGDYGPSRSGDDIPDGSGDDGPTGSGDDIPDGSGEEGPTGSGDYGPSGSGDDIPDGSGDDGSGDDGPDGPSGSGDYGPSGSGDDIPDGSGDYGPSGSGDDIPDGSGEEGPDGSGEEGPTGSGDYEPSGSGDDNPDGSGEEGPDGSGDDGPGGSGDDGPGGSGDDGSSGSGDDGPDGSGDDGPDGSGDDGSGGSGDDGSGGSGDNGPDGSGDDGSGGSGDDGPDGSGDDGSGGSGDDGSGGSGDDGSGGSGDDGPDGSGDDGSGGSGDDGSGGSGDDGPGGSGDDGSGGSGDDEASGDDGNDTPTEGPRPATTTRPNPLEDPTLYPFGLDAGDLEYENLLNSGDGHYWGECLEYPINDEGFPFFGKRHYELNICDNGVISFETAWAPWLPYLFGTRRAYNNIAMMAPFWAMSDASSLSQDRTDVTEHSHIYFHSYAENDGQARTEEILSRAGEDANDYDSSLPDFRPTWALVVTWVRLPPYIGCSCYRGWGCEECDLTGVQTNTFQTVLMTNATHSFGKAIYPSGGLNWVYPGFSEEYYQYFTDVEDLPWPVAGFSAGDGGQNVLNLPTYSGTQRMYLLDEVEGNTGYTGQWMVRMEDSDGTMDARLECLAWYRDQPDPADASVRNALDQLPDCPCTEWQMWFDGAFRIDWSSWGYGICGYSAFPTADGLVQKCCYEDGALVTGSPDGGHVIQDEEEDDRAYTNCCVESVGTCDLFYEKRPSANCSRYVPPIWKVKKVYI